MSERSAIENAALPIIFDPRIGDPLSRLSFSRGAAEPTPEQKDAHLYGEAALIPTLPFLCARAGDFICHRVSSLAATAYQCSFIGLFDLSLEAAELIDFGLQGLNNESEVKVVARSPAFGFALQRFAVALAGRFPVSGDLEMLGVSTKRPGLPTATINMKSSLRPGLHVDSWDSADHSIHGRYERGLGRGQARNRISVNLGAEPRHFVFLNAALSRLANYRGVNPTDDVRVEKLGREALGWSMPPRLTRISLQPGEAYIAPTEDLLHDATTLEKDRIDISLTFLAYIFLPNSSLSILRHPNSAPPAFEPYFGQDGRP